MAFYIYIEICHLNLQLIKISFTNDFNSFICVIILNIFVFTNFVSSKVETLTYVLSIILQIPSHVSTLTVTEQCISSAAFESTKVSSLEKSIGWFFYSIN